MDKIPAQNTRAKHVGLLLMLVLLLVILLPHYRAYSYQGTAVAYSLSDSEEKSIHEIAVEGTITRWIFHPVRFEGKFYVSGIDGLDESTYLIARFKSNRASGTDFWLVDSYGEPHENTTAITTVSSTSDGKNLMIAFIWDGGTNVIVPGTASREETLEQYGLLP